MKRFAYVALCLMALAALTACGDYYYAAQHSESHFERANQ